MATVPGKKEAYFGLLKHLSPSWITKWQTAGNLANSFLWTRRSKRMQDVAEAMVEEEVSNFISPMTHSGWPISSLTVSIPMPQRSRNRRS